MKRRRESRGGARGVKRNSYETSLEDKLACIERENRGYRLLVCALLEDRGRLLGMQSSAQAGCISMDEMSGIEGLLQLGSGVRRKSLHSACIDSS